jgi:uncharacterized protein (DUF433 family)
MRLASVGIMIETQGKVVKWMEVQRMLGFERITFDLQVKGGRACIRGMRITVSLILNLIANGMTQEEILEAYPCLEPEDIQAALNYAAWMADESVYTVERVLA